ncbi:MAG TPA: YtxH domain-containing protein [Candidatus Acidoferrales bacterium]|nr:YtxH domain-containing protein [Candidatus Acidoferrales bacterium]
MENYGGSKVTFLFAGLGLGALVAILFAPRSGEETREYLAKKMGEGKEYAERKVTELRKHADEFVERRTRPITAALEAGQHAYRRSMANARHG